MIILREIKLNNFLSHSDTKIQFEPDRHLLIDGKSGSGKSAIVEGLIWAFYGQGRSDNRALIKKGKAKATVTITLSDDVDPHPKYKIERIITDKGKHDLNVYQALPAQEFTPIKTTGLKDTQEYLEKKILKSSYVLFINSIVYPQDNPENFVKQTAGRRKDIILEIINAAGYDEYLKKAKKELTEIKKNQEVSEALINEKENSIGTDKAAADKLEEREEKEKEIETKKNAVESKLRKNVEEQKLSSEKEGAMEGKKEKIIELEENIPAVDLKIFENKKRIDELELFDVKQITEGVEELNENRKLLAGYEKIEKEIAKWNEDYLVLIKTKPVDLDYQDTIDEINRQMIEIMKEPALICPKCGLKHPKFEEIKQKRVKVLEDQLNIAKSGFEEFGKLSEEYEKKLKTLGEVPTIDDARVRDIEQKIKTLEPFEKQAMELNGKDLLIKELKGANETLEKELEVQREEKKKITGEINVYFYAINSKKADLVQEETDLLMEKSTLHMEYNANLEDLTISRVAAKRIEENKEDLTKLRKELEELLEKSISLELIKEAFGPNGIKAIVIDYVIPQLEDKINSILGQLSDFTIRLETQKSGLSKDILIEGLFITILNENGEEFDFDNYSGGERLKIIVAISEALSEIQKIGFRILDELFIGLDEESTEKFVDVMVILQSRFSQLFCISHLQNIKNMFDNKLLVTKVNGDSRVEES